MNTNFKVIGLNRLGIRRKSTAEEADALKLSYLSCITLLSYQAEGLNRVKMTLTCTFCKISTAQCQSGLEKIDCNRYSIAILYFMFIECTGAFTFLNEY